MAKVTYLFGAGASAKSLPVIKDIPDRLGNFLNFIDSNKTNSQKKYDVDFGITYTIAKAEEDFIKETKELIL